MHLWVLNDVNAFNSDIYNHCLALLSEDERQRMSEFKMEQRKRQYVLSRGALKSILTNYLSNTSAADIVFSTNRYGKPEITCPNSPIKFNLSHSKTKIVIGVCLNQAVGVDIEYMEESRNFQQIADTYFHPKEWNKNTHIYSDICNKRRYFYKIWALKEAFYKAEGKGIFISPSSFFFDNALSDFPQIVISDLANDIGAYEFSHTYLGETFSIAVAAEKQPYSGNTNIVYKTFKAPF